MRLIWGEKDPEEVQIEVVKKDRFQTVQSKLVKLKLILKKINGSIRVSQLEPAFACNLVKLYDQKHEEVIEKCSKNCGIFSRILIPSLTLF